MINSVKAVIKQSVYRLGLQAAAQNPLFVTDRKAVEVVKMSRDFIKC